MSASLWILPKFVHSQVAPDQPLLFSDNPVARRVVRRRKNPPGAAAREVAMAEIDFVTERSEMTLQQRRSSRHPIPNAPSTPARARCCDFHMFQAPERGRGGL